MVFTPTAPRTIAHEPSCMNIYHITPPLFTCQWKKVVHVQALSGKMLYVEFLACEFDNWLRILPMEQSFVPYGIVSGSHNDRPICAFTLSPHIELSLFSTQLIHLELPSTEKHHSCLLCTHTCL